MRWVEVSVQVDREAAEAVYELFNRVNPSSNGASNAVVEANGYNERGELVDSAVTVKTYLPVDDRLDDVRRQIEDGLWHLSRIYPIPEPHFRELGYEDWANAWKTNYKPIRVGTHLVIKPSWAEWHPQPDDVVIEIDPGMAFGTGLHPTTRLCLELLERYARPGMSVLDQGTGSGILSLAAARLGARRVHARDIDATAVRVARENAERNGLSDLIQVTVGSLPPEGKYDLILCNILADVIIRLLPQGLAAHLVPGGTLIASGILDTQAGEVEEAMISAGLSVRERRSEGDWVAIVAQTPA